MREIKFRGVNAASRAVLEVDFVVDIDWMHDEVYFENGTDVATSIGNAKLMQYTGLKDENGVEIYEGDILSGKSKIFGYTNGVVEMCEYNDNEEYMHECHLGWNVCGIPLYDLVNDGLAVIGNIHENPELLK